jgi:glucose/arabinose dehydrogenase
MTAIRSVVAALALLAGAAQAFQLEKVGSINGIPWGMAFVSDTEMLVTAREGKLYRLDTATGKRQTVTGVPAVHARGQGGLLDVAVLPGSDWVYFTYSADNDDGEGVTTLARAKIDGNAIRTWQVLLYTQSGSDTGRHFGSRIAFDGNGHVFFSLGDRGVRDNGQDLTTHAGSILRLKLDGSVPEDNPFVGRDDALPEIWSYGHRNPQGMFFDRKTGELWAIEHGPRGGDEINLIKKGRNYGWAVVSHGKEYWGPLDVGEAKSKPGMEDPVKIFTPSIAPSGLVRYRSDTFPQWQGDFFSGAMKLTHLNRVTLDADHKPVGEERLLGERGQRVRNVIEGPQGYLYVATDDGTIHRLVPDAREAEGK